jgi:hypothetical protein
LAKKTKIKVAKRDIDSATQHVFVVCLKTYAPNDNYGKYTKPQTKKKKKKKLRKGVKQPKTNFYFLSNFLFWAKLKMKKVEMQDLLN